MYIALWVEVSHISLCRMMLVRLVCRMTCDEFEKVDILLLKFVY